MSLDSGDPGQFARPLEEAGLPANDSAAFEARGVFLQRRLFGAYVANMPEPLVATGVSRGFDGAFRIGLAGGAPIAAGILVLATSHPRPAVPEPDRIHKRARFAIPGRADASHGPIRR